MASWWPMALSICKKSADRLQENFAVLFANRFKALDSFSRSIRDFLKADTLFRAYTHGSLQHTDENKTVCLTLCEMGLNK